MKTITEFANQIGISQGNLSNIIAGRRRPSWQRAKLLAEACGVDPVVFLEGEPAEIRAAIEAVIEQAA
jgi:transcriptional regulator with XRE-family HTH domain